MNSIDNELKLLHARIVQLEEMKNTPPKKTLEEVRDETKDQLTKTYSSSVPLARYYDQKKLEMLEAILDKLKNIDKRLNVLEKNGKEEPVYLDGDEPILTNRCVQIKL